MNQWHGMCCVIIISRINHDFNRLHYGLLNVNLVVRLLFMYVSNIVCVVRHHSACCHIQKWLNGREPEFILPSVISKDWIFAHFNFVSRTSLMFVCVSISCVCVYLTSTIHPFGQSMFSVRMCVCVRIESGGTLWDYVAIKLNGCLSFLDFRTFDISTIRECFPTNHSCENGQDSGSDFSSLNPMLIFAIEIEF